MHRGNGCRVNHYVVLAIVAFTLTGMGLAAVLGVFQATSSQTYAADEADTVMMESTEPRDEQPSEESELGPAPLARSDSEAQADATEAPDVDPALQEVRDTYLSMTYSFADVLIRYDADDTCQTGPACANPDERLILIDEQWAHNADSDQRAITLARAHADLAVRTIWSDNRTAQEALSVLVTACDSDAFIRDENRTFSHGDPSVPTPSVTAMKEAVVSLMVKPKDPDTAPDAGSFTSEQIIVAEEIAQGRTPDIVVPVESQHCVNP